MLGMVAKQSKGDMVCKLPMIPSGISVLQFLADLHADRSVIVSASLMYWPGSTEFVLIKYFR